MNNVTRSASKTREVPRNNSDALTVGIFRDHRDFMIFYSAH